MLASFLIITVLIYAWESIVMLTYDLNHMTSIQTLMWFDVDWPAEEWQSSRSYNSTNHEDHSVSLSPQKM